MAFNKPFRLCKVPGRKMSLTIWRIPLILSIKRFRICSRVDQLGVLGQRMLVATNSMTICSRMSSTNWRARSGSNWRMRSTKLCKSLAVVASRFNNNLHLTMQWECNSHHQINSRHKKMSTRILRILICLCSLFNRIKKCPRTLPTPSKLAMITIWRSKRSLILRFRMKFEAIRPFNRLSRLFKICYQNPNKKSKIFKEKSRITTIRLQTGNKSTLNWAMPRGMTEQRNGRKQMKICKKKLTSWCNSDKPKNHRLQHFEPFNQTCSTIKKYNNFRIGSPLPNK